MPVTTETTVPGITIRPFTPDDYVRIAAISKANWPDHEETVEEMRFYDDKRDRKFLHTRFVAENAAGYIVGFCAYYQHGWMFHPRKLGIEVAVDPEYQRQGIGAALYEYLSAALETYEPITLRAHGREDKTERLAFIQKRGFVEVMRDWESRLNIGAFDPAPFAGAAARVAEQGIEIRTLRELESDPDRNHKLYDLDAAISLDMPTSEASSVPDYNEWLKHFKDNPNLLPDGYFIAVDTTANNRYVGLSQLWKRQANSNLDTGATGILPEYRKRGIAMALKLRAVAYATSCGAPAIRTWNAQSNRAMLSINEALGFVKEPAWIEFALNLREEAIPIRAATPRDYAGIVDVDNAVWPEFPGTVQEIQYRDKTHNPKMHRDRFVVERDGAIVAFAVYTQVAWSYHPQKFQLQICVKPEFQGQGIGKALYAHLLAALRPFDPTALTAGTFSDRERAVRFLRDRGFDEVQREQMSRCDPSGFDPSLYVSDLARAEAAGIEIRTFAELKDTVPDIYTKLEEAHWVLHADVPHAEPMTRPDFADWVKRFENPRFLPDGNFIAIDRETGAFVGVSILWASGGNNDLHTGLTAVLAEYRKRGIATALKVRALTYAKERGATAVWTTNEVNNVGMLGINRRLGFERKPDEIQYLQRLNGTAA